MQFSLKELLLAGGPILLILASVSIYSLALVFERWGYFKKHADNAEQLGREVTRLMKNGDAKKAMEACRRAKNLTGEALLQIIESTGEPEERRAYVGAVITHKSGQLHKGLSFLATIGSTAPFIGLFGTVVGVMRAFRDLAAYSGAGPSVVAAGIAEALVNTAAGLFVAIPAIFAYNYFISKSSVFAREIEWAGEEMIACESGVPAEQPVGRPLPPPFPEPLRAPAISRRPQ